MGGKKVMQKRGKLVAGIILGTLCFIFICAISYTIAKQYVDNILYEERDLRLVQEYGQYSGESISARGYDITLDKYIFDKATGNVYYLFRMSKEDSDAKVEIDERDFTGGLLDSVNGFYFSVQANGGSVGGNRTKYDGNDLLIYGHIQYDCYNIEDEGAIQIRDLTINDEEGRFGGCVAKFTLEPNVESYEFVGKSIRINISQYAIKTESKTIRSVNDPVITFYYKDGTSKVVVDGPNGIGMGNSSSYSSGNYNAHCYILNATADVDNIEYILYNEEKIYISE